MKFSTKLASLLVGLMIILSCGGGGGGLGNANTGGQLLRSDKLTIVAGVGINQQLGSIGTGFEVPANARAAGSTLTINQFNPNNSPFKASNVNCRLAAPAVEIISDSSVANGNMALTFPATSNANYIAGYDNGDRFIWLPHVIANGRVHITLPKNGVSLPGNTHGPGKAIWRVVLTVGSGLLPDLDYGLTHFSGGNDFGSPGTILYVHGLMSNGQSMEPLSAQLSPQIGGQSSWSWRYPWGIDNKTFADHFGQVLDQAQDRGKNITIVAHSRAGDLCRYTLERRGKTKAVKLLVTLGSPHTGVWAANAISAYTDALNSVMAEYLNNNWPCSPFGLTISDACIQELAKGSPFLQDLNTVHGTQRGQTHYAIIAGGLDVVVPLLSGRATGVPLESLTGGTVVGKTIALANHWTIKSNPDYIKSIADTINKVGNGVTINAYPNVISAGDSDDGWGFKAYISNNTDKPVKVVDWSFDNFIRDGRWWDDQYFNPNTPEGGFFPEGQYFWNQTIPPHGSYQRDIHVWPDYEQHLLGEAAPEHRAGTVVMTIRGTDGDGREFLDTCQVELDYGQIRPTTADTRRPKHRLGSGLIAPGKPRQ